jgi:serine/threonine protein kinase
LSDSGHTKTGAIIGTIDFMSPEQRRDSSQTDARSDIWSLGATLYQMTTGKSPRIIRFDTVPKSLQEVLGKALEEEKDQRYQSAIEFRDALRGKRVAVGVYDFNEGECPGCLTKNDPTRKFCKKCANSLLALCLSCSESIRVWEEVCDHCGAKQSLLIAHRKEEMLAAQIEAEGLLINYEFDRALTLATPLRDQIDRRLTQLNPWAEQFTAKLEAERTKAYESLSSSLTKAMAYEKTYDYQDALDVMKQIHPSLQGLVLSGYNESINEIQSRLESVTTSVNQLNDSIQKRVESQNLDFLLVKVDQLIALQPRRKDMIALRNQLLERNHKLKMIRDEAFKKGKVLFLNQDYEGCINELKRIDLSVMNEEIDKLQELADRNKARVEALYSEIRQRIKTKQLAGLLLEVNELITLKSDDKHILKLQEQLTERDLKNSRKAQLLSKAQALKAACQFRSAVELLNNMPENQVSDESRELSTICTELMIMRQETLGTIKNPMLKDK